MFPRTGESSGLDEVEAASYGVANKAKLVTKRRTFAIGENYYPNRHTTWTIDDDNESMGDVSIIVNLLADLAPAGILPLSYGMKFTGYVPSLIMLAAFASAAAYMMYLVGRTIETTSQKSYDRMWAQVVGPSTAWVPVFVVFSCLAYACMFGDLFAGCVPLSRTGCILSAALPLWPLCMLKDLSLLAPTSFGALIAVVYTIIAMGVRYFDGSYLEKNLGGGGADEGSHLMTMGPASLQLVNGLAIAFLCHYNGSKYYREFCAHTPGKFGSRVNLAFVLVSILFALAMFLGYGTFGAASDGVVLNNYRQDDGLINIARAGMGLATMFSFPLMFSGLREQAIALLKFVSPARSAEFDYVWFQNLLSSLLLVIVIMIAIVATDASLVVGLVGSICGSATIYVLPCLLFHFANTGVLEGTHLYSSYEQVIVKAIGLVGAFLMVAGAIATVAL
eukprot:CAMPEP_0117548734 /NCGR_PEP_ID=MMETSP0784-20121206/47801_1 /TAXON_ID=39447 /ORGANISM="" /LENGTH=447 /DNA_ID=CAMNT_0005345697 /DNA_START=84 /DNA_END=1427 /DNA_ORIENTATION=+